MKLMEVTLNLQRRSLGILLFISYLSFSDLFHPDNIKDPSDQHPK